AGGATRRLRCRGRLVNSVKSWASPGVKGIYYNKPRTLTRTIMTTLQANVVLRHLRTLVSGKDRLPDDQLLKRYTAHRHEAASAGRRPARQPERARAGDRPRRGDPATPGTPAGAARAVLPRRQDARRGGPATGLVARDAQTPARTGPRMPARPPGPTRPGAV